MNEEIKELEHQIKYWQRKYKLELQDNNYLRNCLKEKEEAWNELKRELHKILHKIKQEKFFEEGGR